MTSIERDTSGRFYIAVLAALQVAILAAVPTSAVGNGRLIDETRLDGTRVLGWTASSPFARLEVVASCLLDEIQESDRLRLRFRWQNMPEQNEGEAILFKVDEGPVQELAARMADDGSIEVLSAEEVISQLIDAEEFVFGVRGAGGAIEQRDGRSTGALDEGLYTLEAFRSRCLNPDQPRARQNTVSGAGIGMVGVSGPTFRIEVADNGDMTLQTNPLLISNSNVLSNDALRFRCLSEPQNWGGQGWSAGTMILAIPRSLSRVRRDYSNQPTAFVSFDEEEPQGIVMSREYTTAEALSISSIRGRHWTIGDASPILAKALVSERMFVGSRPVPVGDLAIEVFINRARRQGCYNNIAAQQPEVPATGENLTPAQTPAQTPTRITDDIIPFIYESRAEVPAPEGELMERISSDYSRFMSDEFARRDLEQQIRPILDRRLLEARAITRVTVEFGSDLGGYDFERSGFPTNHNESTYLPFLGPYAVRFSNAADLSFVPVAEDVARDLVSSMRNNRAISIAVTGTIVRVDQSVSTGKTVYVLAEHVDVALTSGTSVGTLEL